MIALVTDSNAMLPAELAARLGVRIVPLTVVVDGVSLVEDETLDLPGFYAALRRGAGVTTSAPSPGLLAETYVALAGAGATEIVSVHVGSTYSGTVNAAQVAARLAPVPVHIVDSGTASFALGCCVWSAADDLARGGGDAASATAAAKAVTDATTSVFTLGEIERARAGGRIQVEAADDGVPVVAMTLTGIETIGSATDIETAVQQMTRFLDQHLAGPVRVGIGDADEPDAANALAEALSGLDPVDELVRYRCGPTVAAHTGAGTFGAVAWELTP